jgi:cobalt-zinc-cadmium resistance protein CzcA
MSEHLPPHAEFPQRPSSLMNRVVAASLEQRLIVIILTVVLMAAGVRALVRLPVDAYPDLSPPMVEIITQWPGHAAEEMERLVTVPVELG